MGVIGSDTVPRESCRSNLHVKGSTQRPPEKRSCSQCRLSAAHLVFALVLLACAFTFAGCAAPLLVTSRRTLEGHGERAAVTALAFSESHVEALLDNAISLGSAVRYSVRARQNAPIPSEDVTRPSNELIN